MRSIVVLSLLAACDYAAIPPPAADQPDAPASSVDAAPAVDAPPGEASLTVSVGGAGAGAIASTPAGITCGSTCTASFAPGTMVTLTASPAQGSQFAGFSGCSAASTTTCTTVVTGAQSVSASFAVLAPPPARVSHGMVYDSTRQRTVVFSGADNAGVRTDIWEWDGNSWTDRSGPGAPPGRTDFGMVYDSQRQRIVVFGGVLPGNAYAGDTWEWNPATGTWLHAAPATNPPARGYLHMTYDPTRQRTVLFGGFGPSGHVGDTWEWDGTSWTQRTPSPAPVARALGYMTYDTTRQRAVLFGGFGGGTNLNDTWEWDGTSWVDRSPSTPRPPIRNTFAIVYDPMHLQTVLFGGFAPAGGPVYGDTWLWDGSARAWANPTPDPNPGSMVGERMAFDAAHQRVVMFGGSGATVSSDTWEWDGATWTKR